MSVKEGKGWTQIRPKSPSVFSLLLPSRRSLSAPAVCFIRYHLINYIFYLSKTDQPVDDREGIVTFKFQGLIIVLQCAFKIMCKPLVLWTILEPT